VILEEGYKCGLRTFRTDTVKMRGRKGTISEHSPICVTISVDTSPVTKLQTKDQIIPCMVFISDPNFNKNTLKQKKFLFSKLSTLKNAQQSF
jgi:hypothetical protein